MAETQWGNFQTEHLRLVDVVNDEEFADHQKKYDETEEVFAKSRAKLRQKIAELKPVPDAQPTQQVVQQVGSSQPTAVNVHLQTPGGLVNVTNTWGTFSGDYAAWPSFRDRFMEDVHKMVFHR